MSTTNFNVVRFAGAAIWLESPFKLSAGVRPDFNRATCTYEEFASLAIGQTDSMEFFFSDDSSADLTIDDITLLDAEPIRWGQLSGGTSMVAVQYRLVFVDKRYGFVEPRGGRLVQGLVNPSTFIAPDPARANVPAVQSMSDLIDSCATAMNVSGYTLPSITVDPPMDLKWFGTHAPTELEKLLAMADCVFLLQKDGTYGIEARGSGIDPTIANALPETTLTGSDGRGGTVVFTSFPTQMVGVLTQADLASGGGDLVPVIQNGAGAWVPIDGAGVISSNTSAGSAIAALNAHFNVSGGTQNPNEQYGAFRFIRLNPDKFDPIASPILRKTWAASTYTGDTTPSDPDPTDDSDNPNELPPQIDIDLRANIATFNASTGLWTNGSMVKVPVTGIYDGNVIGTGLRMVKLKSGVTSTADLDGNCQAINFGSDINIRLSVGQATWNASSGIYLPAYYYVGFSGTPSSLTTLNAVAAKAAMNDPDTIVIPIAELVAVSFGMQTSGGTVYNDIYNGTHLKAFCNALAARYLADSTTPPRLLAGVGFFDFTMNGRIAEVEIDQQQVMQRFKVDSWFRPVGSYLGREFERLRRHHESHPHEAKTAGSRSAIGASTSSQPVQPEKAYGPPSTATAFQLIAVNVKQSGGTDGSKTSAPSYTYLVFSIDGHQIGSSALSPAWQRSNGSVVKATHGSLYYNASGGAVLYRVDEAPNTAGC